MYKKIKQNLKSFKDGITLNLNGSIAKNKKGYYVSITNNKIKSISVFGIINLLLKGYIYKFFTGKNVYIGGWFDKLNKVWYIDLSLLIDKKINALTIGRQHKQKAIFSLYSMSTIYI